MVRVKVVDSWPRCRRLLLVLASSALLTAMLVNLRIAVNPGAGVAEVLSLVILTAVLVWFSLSEQRVGRAALEGIVFGLGIAVVLSAWEPWRRHEPFGRLMLMAVAMVGMCLAVRLAAHGIVRSFVRRVVLQDGSLCRGCAYNLTGNTSGVCPECGTHVKPVDCRTAGE